MIGQLNERLSLVMEPNNYLPDAVDFYRPTKTSRRVPDRSTGSSTITVVTFTLD